MRGGQASHCNIINMAIWVSIGNPFTPKIKTDQLQISPAASPAILHHTVGRTYLLRWKMIILPILTTSLIHFSLKGWENVMFLILGMKGVIAKLFEHHLPCERIWFLSVITVKFGRQQPKGSSRFIPKSGQAECQSWCWCHLSMALHLVSGE